MKCFSLLMVMGLFSTTALADYTTTGTGVVVAGSNTTRALARTALAAAKSATKVSSTTGTQAYSSCGCPVPNDTGATCMACM